MVSEVAATMRPMNSSPPRARVFLSHSSKDAPQVDRIRERLLAAGFAPWMDRYEVLVGDPVAGKIDEALRDCEFVVVVLSRASVASGWVQKEWQARIGDEAISRECIILPVRLDDCDVPLLLGDKRCADLSTSFDAGLDELVRSLEGHLDRRVTSNNGAPLQAARPGWVAEVPPKEGRRPLDRGVATRLSVWLEPAPTLNGRELDTVLCRIPVPSIRQRLPTAVLFRGSMTARADGVFREHIRQPYANEHNTYRALLHDDGRMVTSATEWTDHQDVFFNVSDVARVVGESLVFLANAIPIIHSRYHHLVTQIVGQVEVWSPNRLTLHDPDSITSRRLSGEHAHASLEQAVRARIRIDYHPSREYAVAHIMAQRLLDSVLSHFAFDQPTRVGAFASLEHDRFHKWFREEIPEGDT